MWWFILGFIAGAGISLELGARWMVRKLKEMGYMDDDSPSDQLADRTVFDQSQKWDFPL